MPAGKGNAMQSSLLTTLLLPLALGVIMLGLGLGLTGLYGIPADSPDFQNVTPSSGVVAYRLLNTGEPGGPPGTTQMGLLLVEMLDAARMRVEAVRETIATTAVFTGNAQVYVR